MANINSIIEALKNISNDINIVPVMKNNGLTLTGISIKGADAVPVIYADEYESDSRDSRFIAEEIYNRLLAASDNGVKGKAAYLFKKAVEDFETARPLLAIRLVNREFNKSTLEGMPWTPFLDLAVTYRLGIEAGNLNASASVTNKMLEEWRVSKETIHEVALENTKVKNPVQVMSLIDKMEEIMPGSSEFAPSSDDTFFLGNKSGYYGACGLFYANKELHDLAEKLGSDLFILPSSVHEVLVRPFKAADIDYMIDMVQTVNRDEVNPEEWLSDTVYRYSREEDKLSLLVAGA